MPRQQSSREEEIAGKVLRKTRWAKGSRYNFDSQWQEVSERFWPMHSRLWQGQKDSGISGDKRTEFIFDSTPTISLNRFGAIVDSLLTPRNSTWHRMVPTDPILKRDRQTMMYFEDVNALLFRLRYAPTANFASQNQFTYLNLGAYGNSALFTDKLRSVDGAKGLRYRNVHLSELWFIENHQGIVDAAVRETRVTPRQIIQWFGEENVPDEIIEMAEDGKEEYLHVIHYVEPREDRDIERRDNKGKAFASYYVLERGAWLLEESGYDCFPYAISRYMQAPNEVYGRGPCMDVLPSVKTLNEQAKTFLKQGHRAVDPVLLAHDDGLVDGFSMRPGALNYGGVSADGRALVHALPVGNIQTGIEMMTRNEATIKSSLLVDLFQILEETPEMTATEVMERIKEKGILLTPVLGRQESEYLGPLVQRELALANELGLLPPPPRKLIEAGGIYHLEYDSPLSRAQKAEQAAGLMRTVESCITVAQQTQDPSILDYFDWDTIIPEYAYINAVPAKWLKDPKMVAMIRQGRQQQIAQEQAVRAAPGQAALMKSAAVVHEKAPELLNNGDYQRAVAGRRVRRVG